MTPEPAPEPTRAGPPPAPGPLPEGSATFWHQAGEVARTAAVDGPPSFAPPPGQAIRPGMVVGGDLEVLAPLGAGGMGAVFRARQRSLAREVALKVLPGGTASGQAAGRFLREARVAAAINHPNVITVFAAGRDEATGRLFIAMELVSGGDAGALAARSGGRLSERRALELARDVARGLTAIEAAGMFHRDVKPANILLAADGTAKLADLGLARGLADRMTQTGAVVGTPAFMSPEQAQGRQTGIDIGTDLYAVGASLYALLTGRPPFDAESVPALLRQVLEAPAPDPRALVPSVSASTAAIVRRAMSKDRSDRHGTAAELVADLERALAALGDEPMPRGSRWGLALVAAPGAVALGLGVVALIGAFAPPEAPVSGEPLAATPSATRQASAGESPADAPAEVAPIRTAVSVSWRRSGPPTHPDFTLTDATTGQVFNHKMTLVTPGADAVEARFTLRGEPRWARLVLDHEAARIGGEGYTYVDIAVNGQKVVARGVPDAERSRRVDLTGVVRSGENSLRIALHEDSTSGYWLRELELQYGSGPPPSD